MILTSPGMSEAAFQRAVLEYAHLTGWLSFHVSDSRRQVTRRGKVQWIGDALTAGFPDLNLARAPRVIYAELKSEKGRLTSKQQRWIEELSGCPGVEVYAWRPSDWAAIERVLR